MSLNDRRDRLVSRCPQCGAWRWREHCRNCDEPDQPEGVPA